MPKQPGVYLFRDKKGAVLYVGKAKNLKNRVSSYFTKNITFGEKTSAMVSQIHTIKHIVVESELESLLLEANLIKKYVPYYNSRLTDGKAYPLIRTTRKDPYPKVLVARRPEDPNSLYFGPYPNAGDMKLVLRTIRKIFPYESVRNHPKKICLYYHLGLCPCAEAFDSQTIKQEYKKTIRHIVDFLNGKTKKVLRDLEKERNRLSKIEEFEKASLLQKKIDAIRLVASPTHKPFEYELNPNLRADIRTKELEELQKYLQKAGVVVDFPHKIECYDISNIQGTNATGSLAVLINGEKETSLYRRFKIRFTPTDKPNDFEMLKEVLRRRLHHVEWEYPDLIVVDGGKGQVSSVLQVLGELKLDIALIGLAKREEVIITSSLKELVLPKYSPALHVIARIRDEAHRFALSYHRKLRSKFALQ